MTFFESLDRPPRVLKTGECTADHRADAVKGKRKDASQHRHRFPDDAAGRNASYFEFLQHPAHGIHHSGKTAELLLCVFHTSTAHDAAETAQHLADGAHQRTNGTHQNRQHIGQALRLSHALVCPGQHFADPGADAQQQVGHRAQDVQHFFKDRKGRLHRHFHCLESDVQHTEESLKDLLHFLRRGFAQLHFPGQLVKPLQKIVQRAAVGHEHLAKRPADGLQHAVDAVQNVQDPVKKVLPARKLVHLAREFVQIDASILNFLRHRGVSVSQLLHAFPAEVVLFQFCVAQLQQLCIAVRRVVDHALQLLCRHAAFFQSLLEASGIVNGILCQQSRLHKALFQQLCVVVARVSESVRPQQLVKAGVKGAFQPVVPPCRAACEHGPEFFRQVAPEALCLLIVAEQDVKGLHPAGTHGVLRCVHRFGKALCFLRGFECFHRYFVVLVSQCFNGLRRQHSGVRVHHLLHGVAELRILAKGGLHHFFVGPLLLQAVVKGAGGHRAFLDLAKLHAGVDEQLFQLLAGHACLFHAFPVDQLDGTGAVALRQIVDHPLELSRTLARIGRGVCHTHDHRDHFLNAAARRRQGRKGARHVRKAVAGLVREPHQLFEVRVHFRDALARCVHDGLDAGSLLGVFVPAAGHLVDGKALYQLFSGVHGLVRDAHQCGHAHHFHRRELAVQAFQCTLHLVKVHFCRCVFNFLKAFLGTFQLQAFVQRVQGLDALPGVSLKLRVVKPHFYYALVNFLAQRLFTSFHNSSARAEKIGANAGLM